jgi:hypothetical protein
MSSELTRMTAASARRLGEVELTTHASPPAYSLPLLAANVIDRHQQNLRFIYAAIKSEWCPGDEIVSQPPIERRITD